MPTDPEQEDIEWMLRARDGDVEAFSHLYRQHWQRMEGLLYRLGGDHARAEDGAQEVFVRLWQARHQYEARARFTTFLYRIARNYWVDELRKERTHPRPQLLDEGHAAVGASAAADPYHELFLRYRQLRIREAIAGLPDTYRLVFVLAHLEGRKLAEIAEILGVPLGTAKWRLHRAVRLLRERLQSEERE